MAQVALGVGALFAGGMTYRMFRAIDQDTSAALETSRVLVASISMPPSGQPQEEGARADETAAARLAALQQRLGQRLAGQPAARQWAFSDATPGSGTAERRGRVDGDGFPAEFPGLPVVTSQVDPGFFETLGVEPVAGRLLQPGDAPLQVGQSPTRVLVNTKFLDRRDLDYPGAVGQMMRISDPGEAPAGPWMEIVGVVPDLEASLGHAVMDGTPMAYLPAPPGGIHPLTLVIDLGADASAFAPTLRTLLTETEPTAILDDVVALDRLPNEAALVQRTASGILVGLSLIAILLSTAALYALMSFTVARRTREIGVRIALGGTASRIVSGIAHRALRQLAIGVTLGSGFWALVFARLNATGAFQGELGVAVSEWPLVLLGTSTAVVAVGLLACLAPTLKGLRIRPVEALRVDA